MCGRRGYMKPSCCAAAGRRRGVTEIVRTERDMFLRQNIAHGFTAGMYFAFDPVDVSTTVGRTQMRKLPPPIRRPGPEAPLRIRVPLPVAQVKDIHLGQTEEVRCILASSPVEISSRGCCSTC